MLSLLVVVLSFVCKKQKNPPLIIRSLNLAARRDLTNLLTYPRMGPREGPSQSRIVPSLLALWLWKKILRWPLSFVPHSLSRNGRWWIFMAHAKGILEWLIQIGSDILIFHLMMIGFYWETLITYVAPTTGTSLEVIQMTWSLSTTSFDRIS